MLVKSTIRHSSSPQTSPQGALARTLAAAAFASLGVGYYVGAYVLMHGSLPGFGSRLAVLAASAAAYGALLVVPIACALVVARALAARLRPHGALARGELAAMVRVALLTVVALAFARRALPALRALPSSDTFSPALSELSAAALFVVLAAGAVIAGTAAIARSARNGATARAWGFVAVVAVAGAVTVAGAQPGTSLRSVGAETLRPTSYDAGRETAVTRAAPHRRVAVLAFDGVDPDLMQVLADRGELPAFAALRERAAYSDLATLAQGLSPPIWTTIATGVRPSVHGIYDFFRRSVAGTDVDLSAVHKVPSGFATTTLKSMLIGSPLVDERPVSPADRRVPAFWTMAAMAGVKSCVIDWMATWPAEPVDGLQISDRTFFWWNEGKVALVTDDVSAGGAPLRFLDTRAPMAGADPTHGLCSPAPDCMRYVHDVAKREAVSVDDGPRFHLAENAFYREIAQRAFTEGECDLMVFYDHLPDFVNHMLKPGELDNLMRGVAESERERTALTMYRDADATLATLLATLDPDVAVLVLSDHGVEIVEDSEGRHVSHDAGPPGIFFFRPSGGAPPPKLASVPTIYDVAPTVLALLGLPIPDYADGHVMDDVVRAELGDGARVRTVSVDLERYAADRRLLADVGDAGVEEQSRERLRALGYVD